MGKLIKTTHVPRYVPVNKDNIIKFDESTKEKFHNKIVFFRDVDSREIHNNQLDENIPAFKRYEYLQDYEYNEKNSIFNKLLDFNYFDNVNTDKEEIWSIYNLANEYNVYMIDDIDVNTKSIYHSDYIPWCFSADGKKIDVYKYFFIKSISQNIIYIIADKRVEINNIIMYRIRSKHEQPFHDFYNLYFFNETKNKHWRNTIIDKTDIDLNNIYSFVSTNKVNNLDEVGYFTSKKTLPDISMDEEAIYADVYPIGSFWKNDHLETKQLIKQFNNDSIVTEYISKQKNADKEKSYFYFNQYIQRYMTADSLYNIARDLKNQINPLNEWFSVYNKPSFYDKPDEDSNPPTYFGKLRAISHFQLKNLEKIELFVEEQENDSGLVLLDRSKYSITNTYGTSNRFFKFDQSVKQNLKAEYYYNQYSLGGTFKKSVVINVDNINDNIITIINDLLNISNMYGQVKEANVIMFLDGKLIYSDTVKENQPDNFNNTILTNVKNKNLMVIVDLIEYYNYFSIELANNSHYYRENDITEYLKKDEDVLNYRELITKWRTSENNLSPLKDEEAYIPDFINENELSFKKCGFYYETKDEDNKKQGAVGNIYVQTVNTKEVNGHQKYIFNHDNYYSNVDELVNSQEVQFFMDDADTKSTYLLRLIEPTKQQQLERWKIYSKAATSLLNQIYNTNEKIQNPNMEESNFVHRVNSQYSIVAIPEHNFPSNINQVQLDVVYIQKPKIPGTDTQFEDIDKSFFIGENQVDINSSPFVISGLVFKRKGEYFYGLIPHFLYFSERTLDEVKDVFKQPYPEETNGAGFNQIGTEYYNIARYFFIAPTKSFLMNSNNGLYNSDYSKALNETRMYESINFSPNELKERETDTYNNIYV